MSFQAYLDNVEAKTGKTPNELIVLAKEKGYDAPDTKAGTIVEWLKQDFDIGRGHAMALVHVIKHRPKISSKHVGSGAHRDESDTLRPDGVAKRNPPSERPEQHHSTYRLTAYELVGRRWTLQLICELISGPRRFTDLHQGLAGISTNMLAARLRELQQAKVIRRRLLPPPAASAVYELTESGSELGNIVYALDQWGANSLTSAA